MIGVGLCGDIGDSFETVAKNVASWDKSAGDDSRFFNTKTGLKVEYGDIRIESEIAEGLRITRFSVGSAPVGEGKGSNFSEWNIEYKKQSGLFLPVSATLQCGRDKARYELIWEIVNEPLKLGIPTAERFQKALPKSKLINRIYSK